MTLEVVETAERPPLSGGEARRLFDALSQAGFKATLSTERKVTVRLDGSNLERLAELQAILHHCGRDLEMAYLTEAEIA